MQLSCYEEGFGHIDQGGEIVRGRSKDKVSGEGAVQPKTRKMGKYQKYQKSEHRLLVVEISSKTGSAHCKCQLQHLENDGHVQWHLLAWPKA